MKHKYSIKRKIGKRKNKSTRKYKTGSSSLPDGFVPIRKVSQDKSVIEEPEFNSSEKNIQELINSRNKSIKQEEILDVKNVKETKITRNDDTLEIPHTIKTEVGAVDIKDTNLIKINDAIFELNNKLSQMISIHEEEKILFSQGIEKIKEKLDTIESLLK